MFQYTKEIILNDQSFSLVNGDTLVIPNVGSYKKGMFPEATIVEARAATYASVTVPSVTTTGKLKALVIKVEVQAGDVNASLANFTSYFFRDLRIEIPAGATAADIKGLLRTAIVPLKEWPIVLSADATTITAIDPAINLQIATEEFTPRSENFAYEGEWNQIAITAKSTGDPGSGTYDLLVHNHRLPTAENSRAWALHKEEYPQAGQLYTMVYLKMVAERGSLGGMHVLGQKATSVTYHRFYVRADKAAAFKTAVAAIADEVITEPVTP